MTSAEINKVLGSFGEEHAALVVPEMESSGKVVPYYGWFWRYVDFDAKSITLGCATSDPPGKDDVPHFVGFMENNKWDHPEFQTTPEQTVRLRELAVDLATTQDLPRVRALYEYLQSIRPAVTPLTQEQQEDLANRLEEEGSPL